MLQEKNSTPTLHQPLHSKVSNYLNDQRRTRQFCDLVLELENGEEDIAGHFCVVAAQSRFIGSTNFPQKSLQFSIHNPLKITIKNFDCLHCLHTIVDFFYEDVVSISKEHEPHFKKLANMLAVTELLNLFQANANAGEHLNEIECTTNKSVETVKKEDIFDSQPNYFKLKNPRATKSNSKINYCIACDFKCYAVREMITHMTSCEASHLTCSLCEVGFLGWREYDTHLRKHSNDLKKPFFCLECDAHFMTRAALLVHLPKHSTEAPHVCPHCSKSFKWKQGLNSHILVHNKEKKMLCDVCGYSTTHMKALNSHKLQHTGEFFECTYSGCKHRANRKENLKLHIETHKQERDFVCEVCGCKFSQSKNLKRHALKHTDGGVKRYKCQLCPFCSHRSDKLKEHVQRVHTEKAIQLELSEIVEDSFENKITDEYNLPIIDMRSEKEKAASTEFVKPLEKSEKKANKKSTVKPEKNLRTLLPKTVIK